MSKVKSMPATARLLKVDLASQERIITRGWEAFIEVGFALKRIRDEKLFLGGGYASFEDYCDRRWGYDLSTASRTINGALVGSEIRKALPTLQLNEAQVRELRPLLWKNSDGHVQYGEVIKVVAELAKIEPSRSLTAEKIKSAVAEKLGRPKKLVSARSMTDSLAMSILLHEIAVREKTAKGQKNVEPNADIAGGDTLRSLRDWLAVRVPKSRHALFPEYKIKGEPIIAFNKVKNPYGWLGNMSAHPVKYEGVSYRTTEALFQCLRFPKTSAATPSICRAIRAEKSPMWAKKTAKRLTRKKGLKLVLCDTADLRRMELCLKLKLTQHPKLLSDLLSTGEATLIEDCSKRPNDIEIDGRGHGNCGGPFWGAALVDGIWRGQNMLGELWMKLRREYRAAQG